ncbi:hypothetical protein ABT097_32885 [Streptomyces sp. NPDC002225]|uniref:hypothetical protein n=1 Tax=Streptomyces sp. NPDC002225 TaxID=3154413 RepID=UPI003330170E
MSSAPIVVHRPSSAGGRRVTAHSSGREERLGTAFSDHDLVVLLEGAGVDDPERVLDDPRWVEWRGGDPHDYRATPPSSGPGPVTGR